MSVAFCFLACLGLVFMTNVAKAFGVTDWLIDPAPYKATITHDSVSGNIVLDNGLARRTIRTKSGCATIGFDNLMTGDQLLRSVRPEAVVVIDGVTHGVGGLDGQPIQNYLDPRWLRTMTPAAGAFQFVSMETGPTRERFPWKRRPEWTSGSAPWPPPGVAVTLHFRPPEKDAESAKPCAALVDVHYELYDGIPLISKWITVRNSGITPFVLKSFTSEILAVVEGESIVDPKTPDWEWRLPALHVETDYNFGSGASKGANPAVSWGPDPLYETQVHYERRTPCLLQCKPPIGPDQVVAPGAEFESFRTFELLPDSKDPERAGLSERRMYRTIAPWVTENPIIMHVVSSEPAVVRRAIDQCADVGFEMLILSFGSGFDFESRDAAYQATIKELADYARARGVALGGYSLLASRGAATAADNTQGVPARFGVMPCLGATWGIAYLRQLRSFIANADLGVLEHDGSYPGDLCDSAHHPGHRGLGDSQWVQWKAITGLYRWCRERGVYLNVPDWYFLNGSTKTGMGYRETNWSLPREYQEIIERQNIFDGTWTKTPSMGWMFVPLTEYHGGGAAATTEPLKDHLPHFNQRLANLFGAGVQACYRGPRLYDGPETREAVKHWVDFYKAHRAILDSDIIHLRRADGRDLDYILHVNPGLNERGLMMVYNPLDHVVKKRLHVPLYYTGLSATARFREQGGKPRRLRLDRSYSVDLTVSVAARGVTWFVIN